MTTFLGSPKTTKGAIIGLDVGNPVASVIIFQYKPETMTRTLAAQTAGGERSVSAEVYPLTRPSKDTITANVDTDNQLDWREE